MSLAQPRHAGRFRRPRFGAPVAAAGLLAMTLALWPARSLAATAASCTSPTAVLPEAPGGPVILVGAALAALVAIAGVRRRRRGGVGSALAATLTVVVLAGSLLSVVAASADTCVPGSVLGTSTTVADSPTPGTGADVPWVNGAILIVGGVAVATVALARRRPRLGPAR